MNERRRQAKAEKKRKTSNHRRERSGKEREEEKLAARKRKRVFKTAMSPWTKAEAEAFTKGLTPSTFDWKKFLTRIKMRKSDRVALERAEDKKARRKVYNKVSPNAITKGK